MAGGFFLGGVAEGMADADKRAIERERLAQDLNLRTRALDLTEARNRADMGINERAQALSEKNAAREASRQGQAVVDKHIADTMAVVSETVKSAVRLAPRAGRDPAVLAAQVDAMLTGPTATEAATVKGTAEGVAEVAKRRALASAGVVDENAGFKDKGQKVTAENSLRDDYLKNSQNFTTLRDFKTRLDNIEDTGAGDLALVFSFMKILDPPSTVREGEQASAQNAAGVPEAVRGLYNQMIGGGKLSAEARKQIKSQANSIYQGAAAQHDQLTNAFAGIAKRQGLNVDNVIVELRPVSNFTGVTPGGLKYSFTPAKK